jgi:transcriptional accessory protein Tex/SPT6
MPEFRQPDIEQLCELVKRYEVQVIVIGNNNHCREVEKLVAGTDS